MKHNNQVRNQGQNKNKQSGYTIAEFAGVGVLAVIVVLGVYTGVAKLSSIPTKTAVMAEVLNHIPSGILQCTKINRGDMTTCTADNIIQKVSSLETGAKTPCGDTWTFATAAADKVVLNYFLTSCEDKDSLGEELLEVVKKLPRIDKTTTGATSYDSANSKLKVTFLKK